MHKMKHLKWDKFVIKKEDSKLEITSRKVAYAKRALEKKRAKAGLFGEELMRFKTIEERFEMMKFRKKELVKNMRHFEAKAWREARKLFKSFSYNPSLQKKIIEYWNNSEIPKNGTYLIETIYTILEKENLVTSRVKTIPAKIENIDNNR